jgi:hypothetical protein
MLLLGHVVGSLDGEFPLAPKIAFEPLLRMLGDYWNEQSAVADLAPNLLIPYIPASQFALIEPHLNAGCAQCIADLLCRIGILRGVAQKYRVRCLSHDGTTPDTSPEVSHRLRGRQLSLNG